MYSVNGGPEKTVHALRQGREGADGSQRRPHGLSRRAGREARRLRVLLREGARQRHREGTEDVVERHLLHRRSGRSARTSAQAQSQARRRGRRRRRRPAEPGRRALRAAAADHLGDVQRRARQGEDDRRQVQGRHGVRAACRRRKLREEVEELVGQMRQRLGGGGGENLQKIAEAAAEGRRRRCRRPRTS